MFVADCIATPASSVAGARTWFTEADDLLQLTLDIIELQRQRGQTITRIPTNYNTRTILPSAGQVASGLETYKKRLCVWEHYRALKVYIISRHAMAVAVHCITQNSFFSAAVPPNFNRLR